MGNARWYRSVGCRIRRAGIRSWACLAFFASSTKPLLSFSLLTFLTGKRNYCNRSINFLDAAYQIATN